MSCAGTAHDALCALQVSNTSDITGHEGSSFERERDALRERKMDTIPEPGETPLRDGEDSSGGRRLFARSADGGLPILATPGSAPCGADTAASPASARSKQWLEGLRTPRGGTSVIPPVSPGLLRYNADLQQTRICSHS